MIGVAVNTAHDAAILRSDIMATAWTTMHAAVDGRCCHRQFFRSHLERIMVCACGNSCRAGERADVVHTGLASSLIPAQANRCGRRKIAI